MKKRKKRFLLLAERLPQLSAKEVTELNVQANVPIVKQSTGLLDE